MFRPDIFPFKEMPGQKVAQNEVEAQYQANQEAIDSQSEDDKSGPSR